MGPLWTLRLGQSGAAPFPLTKPDISSAHLQLMCPCGPDSLARSRERDKNSLPPHLLLLSHSTDSCVYLYATDSELWCAFYESHLIFLKSAWFELWAEREPRGQRRELLPFLMIKAYFFEGFFHFMVSWVEFILHHWHICELPWGWGRVVEGKSIEYCSLLYAFHWLHCIWSMIAM